MSRAARFAAAYAALMPAHDLADHIVQTDHQAAHKAATQGWHGPMAGHVGGYTAVQLVAVLALRQVGVRPSWRRTLAAVAVSAATHAVIDRRWPVTRALELTRSPRFARTNAQPARALDVRTTQDSGDDLEKAGRALGRAAALADAAEHDPELAAGRREQAGEHLADAVRHAVEVIDPPRPTPLHGPYLADQAMHHVVLAVCAAILAGGRR